MGSLDKWREYFGKGDSDIFGIIDHAIMVAAADSPIEFKSRRDGIAQLLFSCRVCRCVGCGHVEDDGGVKTVEETGGGKDVDEVLRIKEVLFNKDDEPNSVVFASLRKLESMSLSVEMLKDTEIGKAVTGLRRHGSDKIRKLAKALFAEWKEMVDQWMNIPKDNAVNDLEEWTPESANLSVVEEEDEEEPVVFPSPPHDLDFFSEPAGFELSQILDGLDCDGNLFSDLHLTEEEPKHERNLQSSVRRRPDGTNEGNVAGRHNNNNHRMRREEADVKPTKHSATDFDEPRRKPQSRERTVPATHRKPVVAAEQKRKPAVSQRDNLKDMDPDAKFEFAKRKLQESYQNHEKAKRQRTIQVLETIPNQGKAKKPQFRRPVRR